MVTKPELAGKMNRDINKAEIVIVNQTSGNIKIPSAHQKELDGFESHRVYVNKETNRIYLLGYDLRGTIFAIYTFAEEILGIPPLKYWSSSVPQSTDIITIPAGFDSYYKSPQVRYRSLLPGDQDFFNPWKDRIRRASEYMAGDRPPSEDQYDRNLFNHLAPTIN
jgi:hypothetical protein